MSGDRELDAETVEREVVSSKDTDIVDSENPRAVLKADTNGSLEALKELLKGEVEVVESSVGDIVDSDAQFAKSTDAVIIGFMVKTEKSAVSLAEVHNIKIFTSKIIYELLDAVKKSKAEAKHGFTGGELETLATFSATSSKQTIGGRVIRGSLKVGTVLEIEREGELMGKGRIRSLQYNKENINEVGADKECGLVIETTIPIQKGDLLKIIR